MTTEVKTLGILDAVATSTEASTSNQVETNPPLASSYGRSSESAALQVGTKVLVLRGAQVASVSLPINVQADKSRIDTLRANGMFDVLDVLGLGRTSSSF